MGKVIFELFGPILLCLYGIIEIIIPLVSMIFPEKYELSYFWFSKGIFKRKPKISFADQLKNAEKAYHDAMDQWIALKDSATKESEEAKKRLAKAEEVYTEALKKAEDLKKKST